jgi:GTP cyclohydrolase I
MIFHGEAEPGNYYGVPRGGSIISGLMQKFKYNVVDTPEEADYIVDDLIDSGTTMKKYKKLYPDKPFIALYDKRKEFKNTWLQFPYEETAEKDIEEHIIRQLEYIGEDTNREGLKETPKRVVKSWEKLYGGYKQDPKELLKTFDKETYDQMIILKDIEFYSTCEHHLLNFSGKAHIAYIPKKKVIGVSKLARLLEIYSRRLQIQERIGEQITDFLMKELEVEGAGCILEAQHLCMTSRGIQKQHSKMITSSLQGTFRDSEVRQEFINLIGG